MILKTIIKYNLKKLVKAEHRIIKCC